MSDLLIKLGDDWHNPHPYEKLILAILPGASNDLIDEIEGCLLKVYEAEHYNFKFYKDRSKGTLYDDTLSRTESRIHLLNGEQKKEEEGFQKLCKKLEETIQEQRKNGFLQGEAPEQSEGSESDEQDETEDYTPEKDVQIAKTTKEPKKNAKEEAKKRRELELRLATTVKQTQSAMASVQQKLLDYQKEMETLEVTKEYYEHYQYAALCYQNGIRKVVLEYEKTHDLEALVKGIKDVLVYYTMMRRRYIPNVPCKGSGKTLCETHRLPLGAVKYSEKGEAIEWKCNLFESSI